MHLANYEDTSLIFKLDCTVENLKGVFEQLNGVGFSEREKNDLERQKDRYFRDLNELLPQLASYNNLYGEYISEKLAYIHKR
ncbi:MAG: hypothetical protein ACRC1P_10080 [Cellulosilyticaceae bacterium]